MDSDKVSAQVGRLEVVETGRRRRWSEDEKLKIVLESLQAPRQVGLIAHHRFTYAHHPWLANGVVESSGNLVTRLRHHCFSALQVETGGRSATCLLT